MEKWIFDSPDVPAETFRQYDKDCYQENLLIQNRMKLNGKRIDLRRITMPVLNFYGRYDHLVPPEACAPLIEKIGSRDGENVCLDTGHSALRLLRAQKEVAPRITRCCRRGRKGKGKSRKSAVQKETALFPSL